MKHDIVPHSDEFGPLSQETIELNRSIESVRIACLNGDFAKYVEAVEAQTHDR